MAATRQEISSWFERGRNDGAAYMLVMCDTFDWEDYPFYAHDEITARAKLDFPGSMQKVMEVYDLGADLAPQLNKQRCWALKREPQLGHALAAPSR